MQLRHETSSPCHKMALVLQVLGSGQFQHPGRQSQLKWIFQQEQRNSSDLLHLLCWTETEDDHSYVRTL